MIGREAASRKRGESGAGSIDVIDAPAPERGAVRFLLGKQPVEAALDLGRVAWFRRQRLQRVGADVCTRLVRDLAEVAERQLVEPVSFVVDVEGAPTAAARLHPGGPRKAALDGASPEAETAQRKCDDGRVVDVRVEVVLELERPAPRSKVGLTDRPVPGNRHLLADQPIAGAAQGGMCGRDT